MQVKVLLVLIFWICCVKGQNKERDCYRNLTRVEEGRSCRKPCRDNSDCRGPNKRCICDDVCGMSCIGLNSVCSDPPPLLNGTIVYAGRRYKDEITYRCNDGFVLQGSPTRSCRSDRKWSGFAPTCENFNTCGISGNFNPSRNVLGSRIAQEGAWPWHGTIFDSSRDLTLIADNFLGGASLLNENWFITAAGLIPYIPGNILGKNLIIVFGMAALPNTEYISEQFQIFEFGEVVIHPKYLPRLSDYDVALVRVGRKLQQIGNELIPMNNVSSVEYNYYVRPVCLPCFSSCTQNYLEKIGLINQNMTPEERCRIEGSWLLQRDIETRQNGTFIVTGHGRDTNYDPNRYLKELTLKQSNNDECEEGWIAINEVKRGLFPFSYASRMLCVSSKQSDACRHEDLGGPFVREVRNNQDGSSCWVQVGIVTYSFGCGTTRNGNLIPGFYTSILPVLDWIISHISEGLAPCRDENGNPINRPPYEIPGDCYNFYECSDGDLHIQSCESATAFNPLIRVCDFPRNVPYC